MSEEKHIETSSVGIRRDASGNVIIAGKENTANVTIIMQQPSKDEQPNKSETVPNNSRPKSAKMCNRDKPKDDFIEYFQDNCEKYPGRPQIYLIHGEIEERHDSFIERIRWKELKQLWKDDYIDYSDDNIPVWPAEQAQTTPDTQSDRRIQR